jgi:glycerophosphoryl diester phosphodiesterase
MARMAARWSLHLLAAPILIAAVIAGAPGGAAMAGERAPLPAVRWPVAVIGHRAGARIAPENTLAAIRQAIRRGADYVEIDLRTTKDGALVIMHDSTVDGMTNGTGRVRDLTLAEVRALRVKNRFGKEFDDQRVPTLDEVLALCKGRISIYVDDKDSETSQTLAAIRKRGMERRIVVYTGPQEAAEWKRLAPTVPVMVSVPDSYRRPGGIAAFVAVCPAEVLDGHFSDWTKELVADAHALGVKVYVDIMGATDTATGFAAAVDMGVDGIQTDDPIALMQYLRDRKRGHRQ